MEKSEIRNLASVLGKMKAMKRNGWLKRGIKDTESAAEHSYSLAMLVLLLTPQGMDQLKCFKLALVHDLPEILCGDFVPGEIDPEEKGRLELDAMSRIAANIGSEELTVLFDEFLAQETPEAKFVRALDKLDNVFTACFYEDKLHKTMVKDFWPTTYPAIQQLPENVRNQLLSVLMALS